MTAAALAPSTATSWHSAGHWVEVGGFGAVHVVSPPLAAKQGSATAPSASKGTIVLLHGYLQSSWSFRHNIEAFAAHYQVHALCVPGFGWSAKPRAASYRLAAQAERVLAVLDTLHIHHTHIVGNSLGAALGLQVALAAPERVGKLVLVNPAGSRLGWLNPLVAVQHPLLEPVWHVPGLPRLLGLGLKHAAYAGLRVDRQFVARFFAQLDTPGARAAALQVAHHFGRDLRALEARVPAIHHTAQVLWGMGDRIVPRTTAERLAALLPNAHFELFDCSAHCPMEEEPLRFNREVLQFLRRETARP